MNRSTSFLLPRLNVTEEPTFNQTISLADLTERPTESFQLSEDRATTEAYALYHDFLNIFQASLDAERNGYLIFLYGSYESRTLESFISDIAPCHR